MAKPSQTFKKRQREHKLREKAQMKRDRRQQRQLERKASQAAVGQDGGDRPFQNQIEPTGSDEPGAEQND